MKTEKPALAQQNHCTHADVLPEGRRPEGEASATTSQHLANSTPDPQVKPTQRAPRRSFSTQYKLNILEEYDACDNPLQRGALLRREGLYHARLSAWRKQRETGKLSTKAKRKLSKAASTNQRLTRENAQLRKKLAQADAVIELQKKVSELLGTHILSPESSETSS